MFCAHNSPLRCNRGYHFSRYAIFAHECTVERSTRTLLIVLHNFQGFFGKGEYSRGAAEGITYVDPAHVQNVVGPTPRDVAMAEDEGFRGQGIGDSGPTREQPQERQILSSEEAFFLAFGLGCLLIEHSGKVCAQFCMVHPATTRRQHVECQLQIGDMFACP
jgi:hypothetical protein